MAALAEQIQLLPQIVSDTRTTNYLTLVAFVVFLYDMILTFPRELELVWKARWTTGKALFLLNRYPVFMISTFLLVYMFDYYSAFDYLTRSCVASNYVEAWSMLVFIVPVQVILILRTLALWHQNRKILIFLITALVATDSTIIVSISLITKSLSFENRPITKQILGCFGTLDEVSTLNAIPSWVALMLFDTIVFVLTFVRVEGIRRAKKDQSRLLHILFRDGIAFYLIMLASSIANLTLYAALPMRRRGLIISLIPLLRTIMSVCTARLLLNLRAAAVGKREVCDGEAQGEGVGMVADWALGDLEFEARGEGESTLASRTLVSSSGEIDNKLVGKDEGGSEGEGRRPSQLEHWFGGRSVRVPSPKRSVGSIAAPTSKSGSGSRSHSHSRSRHGLGSVSSTGSISGSERGRILVSVMQEAQEFRDEGESATSFRMSILSRFPGSGTGVGVGFDAGEEFGERRRDGREG